MKKLSRAKNPQTRKLANVLKRPVVKKSKPVALRKTAANKQMSLRELRHLTSQIARTKSRRKFQRLKKALIKGYYGSADRLHEPNNMAVQPKATDSTKQKVHKKATLGGLKLLPIELEMHNNFGEEFDGSFPPALRMTESPAKKLRRQLLESVRVTNRSWRYLYKAFRDADIKLLRQAEKSFGGAEGAGAFLARAALGLNGKIPILHTVTKKGRAEVMLLMKRIDRGILV